MKTLVIGASERTTRYSNLAIRMLRDHGHEVEAVGLREGKVWDVPIQTGKPDLEGVDTVTLYVGTGRQGDLVDYVVGLKPRRVIFNPGTENPEFEQKLQAAGIKTEEACTLVLLSTGQF